MSTLNGWKTLGAFALVGLVATQGCGKKTAPEAAPEAAVAAPVAAPPVEPAPVVEAEPPPPPPPANNADVQISLARADGSQKSGHVKRIERSADWYGDEGWTEDAKKLTLTLESSTEMLDVTWDQISKISVTASGMTEVNCTYSSEANPWIYTCELPTPTKATLKDGRTFDVTSRHKWRFTWDDDSQAEFWLSKHPARQQDEKRQTFDEGGENLDMYVKLQDQLREEVKTLVKSISIQ